MRRNHVAAVMIAAGSVLAGCSSDEVVAPEAPPSAAPATYNPCDGLVPEQVEATLGVDLTMDDGSENFTRCAFNPDLEGGPVLDANYSIFPDGLDAVFDSMSVDPEAVREVAVAGADAARIVVDSDGTQLFLSGFVQNGELIQTLDLVAPEPYDEQKLIRGVRLILGELSAHALDDPP